MNSKNGKFDIVFTGGKFYNFGNLMLVGTSFFKCKSYANISWLLVEIISSLNAEVAIVYKLWRLTS